MEEKKEKKTIKCSYAVLVIILFAALAFVTDYAFIERKISKCDCPKCEATNNEVISGDIEDKDNTDNTQVTENQTYSYEDIAGVYNYDDSIGQSYIKLYLYTDGSYYYQTSIKYVSGIGGYYTIKGNEIILNSIFTHGSDIGREIVFSESILQIDESGDIIDNNPTYLSIFDEYENVNFVSLSKKESYNDSNNTDSQFKKVFSFGEFKVSESNN